MKTILVPTDLSPITAYALNVAVDLARAYQAEIVLLHTVLSDYIPPADCVTGLSFDIGPVYEEAWKEADKELHKLATNPNYAGVTIKTQLGSNLEGLIRCINEQPADLIVLASKGSSGLMEWLEGSHAELIVRHATCPVLVVKQPVIHFKPERIVYGIDLEAELKKPHSYPFPLDNSHHRQFLYVMTPTDNRLPEGIRAWVDEFASVNGMKEYNLHLWHDKTVPGGILHYADEVKADLIVLFTHGHKGLQHWLKGSVAEDVLNHSQIPVLIMRL